MNKKIESMKQILEVQGSSGNWNYDNYMLGIFNGMELMMATLEDREPLFRKCKEKDFLYINMEKGSFENTIEAKGGIINE